MFNSKYLSIMKNYLLLAFAAVALLFAGCKKDDPGTDEPKVVAVTGVSLNTNAVALEVDDSVTLTATVAPANATNKGVEWSVADDAIATVKNGVVTAVAIGETTVTVTTVDGGFTASATITVAEGIIKVTGVTLDKPSLELEIGDSDTLTATVAPDDATNKAVSWSSANDAIATVEDGVVTAVAAGETTVTVTTADGAFKATANVVVKAAPIKVTGVSLDQTMVTLEIGESVTVEATVTPENATNKTVEWSIADTAVATVANGVVTGVAEGETTLTATTADGGHTATIPVKVVTEKIPVTGINMTTGSNMEIYKGKQAVCNVDVLPANATDSSVKWSSSNESVATVIPIDGEGDKVVFIKGVSKGTAIITATTNDGGFKAYCEITVLQKVTEIKIGPENATIEVGERKKFAAEISPSDAENKAIEWSSSDTAVATVDANGWVTGVAKGEVTITAAAKDGSGVTGTATVKVTDPITALTFDGQTEAQFVTWHGNEVDLKAAADGDLKALNWVFTPDQDTEYTEVISSDKATITAWSNENDMQSVVSISVGKQKGGILARATVTFRTTARMYIDSDYKYHAAWWTNENNFSYTVTTAKEKYYFVAYCAPLSHSATDNPEMYFPDSYIPTSEYTLTTNNDKVTVKKLNDKCYEITDSDLSTYKELVLTYTCGKQTFTYTTKIVPR